MTSTAPAEPRPTGTPERRRWVDWLLGLLWIGAIVAATLQQGVARQNNNFRIFRAASRHLIAGSDLYAAYPAEHFDFYKYSPTFALLFAPFAYVPFPLAMLLWNALNAGALYVALGAVSLALYGVIATQPDAALVDASGSQAAVSEAVRAAAMPVLPRTGP